MYYDKKGRDFRLLMNLLAEKSDGLAQSFRILCVFDKHFQRLWRPQEHKVIPQRLLNLHQGSSLYEKETTLSEETDKGHLHFMFTNVRL